MFLLKILSNSLCGIKCWNQAIRRVNQLAIQVVKECGVDISNQKSKIITEDIIRNADFLLNSENQVNLNKTRIEEGIFASKADPLLVGRAVDMAGFKP